jgi:NDP-sugar pyrophosphorylase family protein
MPLPPASRPPAPAPVPSGAPRGPFRAFLLAAGLGTRLRPLTDLHPKPLLEVGGLSLLDRCLALLAAHGVAPHEVLVNAHHLWAQVAAWAEARGVGLQVELPEVLGTGGALRAARDHLAPEVLVLNGDILCDVDLGALLAALPPDGAALTLREDPRLGAAAPVEADAEGVVTRMRDFAGAPGPGRPGTHFTGVYAISRTVIDRVPPGAACILRSAVAEVLPTRRVRAVLHRGLWEDIGAPAQLLDAQLLAARSPGGLPGGVGPGYRALPYDVLLGPGAQVAEGARLRSCVIGAGAQVAAGASLDGCAVWPGVRVPPGDWRRTVLWGPPGEPARALEVDALAPARV